MAGGKGRGKGSKGPRQGGRQGRGQGRGKGGGGARGDADALARLVAAGDCSPAAARAVMAQENGLGAGTSALAAVRATLAALEGEGALPPLARMRLAGLHVRAGLVPPPEAMLSPEAMVEAADGGPDPGEGPGHGGGEGGGEGPATRAEAPAEMLAEIDRTVAELERMARRDTAAIFQGLSEVLAAVPETLRAGLIALIAARPGPTGPRLAAFWLCDASSAARLAAAQALAGRAQAGTLAPETAALLPTLRKWLPEEPARAALDAALRAQLRSPAAPEAAAWTCHRLLASLPDGAGAQSLMAAVSRGGRRGLACVLLKAGQGVADAFLLPASSAADQRRLLARMAEETGAGEVAPGLAATLIGFGLAEGRAAGRMPPAGLVELIPIFGDAALRPGPEDAEGLLAAIGGRAALAAEPAGARRLLCDLSAGWAETWEVAESWFEDSDALAARVGRARTPGGVARAVWAHLETRRGFWARLFAVAAATLRAGRAAEEETPPAWLTFAAVAEALLDGVPLKRLPAMQEIAAATRAALAAGGLAMAEPPEAPEAPGELAGLLAAVAPAGGPVPTPAWLDGFLTAMLVAPRPVAPETWAGALLGGLEFPGEARLQRFLGLLTARLDRLAEALDAGAAGSGGGSRGGGGTGAIRAVLPAEPAALAAWAAGFAALVAAARGPWSRRGLARDDRHLLDLLAAAAGGADPAPLAPLLPAWLAERRRRAG